MEAKPRLLDLFCGAGGAAVGYSRAGFEVVGVDIKPQRYPFEFVQADALELLTDWLLGGNLQDGTNLDSFDAIHASPPCQAFTRAQKLQGNTHPDLIGPTRNLLEATGLPYVIENVDGAPLVDAVPLTGPSFGLNINRRRWFEANWPLEVPVLVPPPLPQVKMGRRPNPGEAIQVVGHFSDVAAGRAAMGIDWMTRDELSEAIPPAYTEFIGAQLVAHLKATAPA